MRLWIVAAMCVLAWGQELPQPPGVEVYTLTAKPGYFTEPSIAINSRNPNQIAAAFQDNAHVSYSADGGRHWELASGTEAANYKVSGDVSIVYDNQGRAFLCYIAFDKLGTFNYWGHNSSRNGIFVRRSLDGGKTWEVNHIPVSEQADGKNVPWEDKPYIVADSTRSRFAGNLYIGWTRWTIEDSQIVFSRSTDGGKTWSKPMEIDKVRGLPRDDTGALEGFSGTVAPDGTLYAVWSDATSILFTSSRDGGRTFTTPRSIAQTAPIMFHIQSLDRTNGFPVIASDPLDAKRLYLSWSDYRNGDVDVFCAASTDGGKTWGKPVRVNNDPPHNGADQFFHWLAIDPQDGSVDLVFYDRRIDPENKKQIVVLARSVDGGRTFTNYAWTKTPFEAEGVFFGDYSGIAARDGRVYGVWTEKPDPQVKGTVVRVGVADFRARH
jgi:hypothetical protein